MTKIKKLVAAAVAAATVGALGVTAFATEGFQYYKFSIEGRDDLYYNTSSSAYKSNGWSHPAEVKVEYGNLNANNRAFLAVTGDDSWPEDYVLSEEVTLDGINDCIINYDKDFVVKLYVYLLATTGDNVTFEGEWKP